MKPGPLLIYKLTAMVEFLSSRHSIFSTQDFAEAVELEHRTALPYLKALADVGWIERAERLGGPHGFSWKATARLRKSNTLDYFFFFTSRSLHIDVEGEMPVDSREEVEDQLYSILDILRTKARHELGKIEPKVKFRIWLSTEERSPR